MTQKGTIIGGVIEGLAELGKKTVTQTAEEVAKTVNPITWAEIIGSPGSENAPSAEEIKNKNATPLNMDRLNKTYKKNDAAQLSALRKQFSRVKSDEERAQYQISEERRGYEQKLAQEAEDKKRRQLQTQQTDPDPIPRGKVRRSILSGKVKKQKSTLERKADKGKQ